VLLIGGFIFQDSHTVFRNLSAGFGQVENSAALLEFGAAFCGKAESTARCDAAREALLKQTSAHAVLDAAGTVGMFVAISRIVDITGHKSLKVAVMSKATEKIVFLRRNFVPVCCPSSGSMCVLSSLRES